MSIITNYARTSQQQTQKGKETDLDIVSNDRLIWIAIVSGFQDFEQRQLPVLEKLFSVSIR
jgi:hypothetical protein